MFHLDGLVPVRLGDAVQQPPQRRDAPGADREEDVLVVRGAGNLPGEIPGVDAGGDAAAGPARSGRAPSARRSRSGAPARGSSVPAPRSAASTISVSAHAATCGRPTRCP